MCSSNSISWLYLTLRAQISYACKGVKILCVSRLLKRSARMLGQGFEVRAGMRDIEKANLSIPSSDNLEFVSFF
jgi:hypothetical protein